MRKLVAFGVALSLVGLVWAFPVTVADDRGMEITIAQRPERIVVLLPLYAEILMDLGAEGMIVGLADSPDNPPELSGLPSVGPSFSPSLEAIVALEPDLVLGAWGDIRDKLEELGITVLTVGGPGGYIRGIVDIFDAIRTVGVAAGLGERAAALTGTIAEEIVRIEARVLGLPKLRVAFIYMSAPDTAPWAAGRDTPENELILRAGGENAFADLVGFPQASLEELVTRDPEVILTDPSQVGNILESRLLQGISAVRDGRVYGIKASAAISTRVAEVLQKLAELLHPEAFREGGGE
jgi:iron complex transport system substrate-binding protein